MFVDLPTPSMPSKVTNFPRCMPDVIRVLSGPPQALEILPNGLPVFLDGHGEFVATVTKPGRHEVQRITVGRVQRRMYGGTPRH
jgi:hypothetical protein